MPARADLNTGDAQTAELIERARNLGLRALTLVDGVRVGEQASPRRGFSVEFAQHREYVAGDDLRHIDWRAYGRSERLMIKEFRQETNFTAHIVVDQTGSMAYPPNPAKGQLDKAGVARLMGLVVAQLASSQGDASALWLASAADPKADPLVVPAGSRAGSLIVLLKRLASFQVSSAVEDPQTRKALVRTLESLASRPLRRGMVVVISDFLESWDEIVAPLRQIRVRGHDLILLQTLHGDEIDLPWKGEVRFDDLESSMKVMARPHQIRDRYRREVETWLSKIGADLQAMRADHALVLTDEDTASPVLEMLARRLARRKAAGRS